MGQSKDRATFLKMIGNHWVLRMAVGIRKLRTGWDGWIYGINVPMRL